MSRPSLVAPRPSQRGPNSFSMVNKAPSQNGNWLTNLTESKPTPKTSSYVLMLEMLYKNSLQDVGNLFQRILYKNVLILARQEEPTSSDTKIFYLILEKFIFITNHNSSKSMRGPTRMSSLDSMSKTRSFMILIRLRSKPRSNDKMSQYDKINNINKIFYYYI